MVYNCVKRYGWDSCSWMGEHVEHPDWLLVAPTLGCVNTWKLYRTMGWTDVLAPKMIVGVMSFEML